MVTSQEQNQGQNHHKETDNKILSTHNKIFKISGIDTNKFLNLAEHAMQLGMSNILCPKIH